jgi:hypothetical protein
MQPHYKTGESGIQKEKREIEQLTKLPSIPGSWLCSSRHLAVVLGTDLIHSTSIN